MDRPGSNQEYQLVDERLVARKPTSLDFADAAALPLTAITAWETLFDRFRIQPDLSEKGTLLVTVRPAASGRSPRSLPAS